MRLQLQFIFNHLAPIIGIETRFYAKRNIEL